MGWYIVCWMRTFDYTGKSGRMEYWYYIGISLVILSFASIAVLLHSDALNWIYGLVALNLFPYTAVLVRRVRDAGYSPWWALWRLVPVVGQAVILYMTTRPSSAGVEAVFSHNPGPVLLPVQSFND